MAFVNPYLRYTRVMYLAIDIGGTKTLLAVFSKSGEVVYKDKIPTSTSYPRFLESIEVAVTKLQKDYKFDHCCCAVPGLIDRKHGIGLRFGRLTWANEPIKTDLEKILGCSVVIENDANLAGLSEALLVHNKYKNVLYLTISTGIGDGIIINGKIDPAFEDSESGNMVLNYQGSLQKWQDFASGKALAAKYGKKASEINDPAIWKEFVVGLAAGIGELAATIKPQVIIIGGGVGNYFEKFEDPLKLELKKYENNMVPMPPIVKAKRPEEAVIYGCYELIKQQV